MKTSNKVVEGVEIVTIYGKVAEGKTTTIITDYMGNNTIMISNEMSLEHMVSRINNLRPDMNIVDSEITLLPIQVGQELKTIGEFKIFSGVTLLLDGMSWTDEVVSTIVKLHPHLTKIVRTCQLCRDGSIPRNY